MCYFFLMVKALVYAIIILFYYYFLLPKSMDTSGLSTYPFLCWKAGVIIVFLSKIAFPQIY